MTQNNYYHCHGLHSNQIGTNALLAQHSPVFSETENSFGVFLQFREWKLFENALGNETRWEKRLNNLKHQNYLFLLNHTQRLSWYFLLFVERWMIWWGKNLYFQLFSFCWKNVSLNCIFNIPIISMEINDPNWMLEQFFVWVTPHFMWEHSKPIIWFDSIWVESLN